jgi:hypothetical protein
MYTIEQRVLIYNTLQSMPHGKNVIGSFVKNIHQQCHVNEQHQKEWKPVKRKFTDGQKHNIRNFFFQMRHY